MTSARYVIIGAGFAGATTAYHLARRGVSDVILLEQESTAGMHSSGRNASMVRQVVSDPALASLTRDGAAFFHKPPADWPTPAMFQQSGSLLLGAGEKWKGLKHDAEAADKLGIGVEIWSRQKTEDYVPALRGAEFEGAVWCSTDGVVDIHGLITGYLKGATALGIQVRYGCEVQGVDVREGRVAGVLTSDGIIKSETVINAAGAWAGTIGRLAGATAVPLHPCRRHLFLTAPLFWVDPQWPFVWDVAHEIYFRPDSGGLLLCPCDQEEMTPCLPPTDDKITELLADKVKRHLPGISEIAIRKSWAGLRTLSEDGRFVIGWDPRVHGFFWVAGFGGHGVTTSPAVGALAASILLEGDGKTGQEFSPARFT